MVEDEMDLHLSLWSWSTGQDGHMKKWGRTEKRNETDEWWKWHEERFRWCCAHDRLSLICLCICLWMPRLICWGGFYFWQPMYVIYPVWPKGTFYVYLMLSHVMSMSRVSPVITYFDSIKLGLGCQNQIKGFLQMFLEKRKNEKNSLFQVKWLSVCYLFTSPSL